MNGTRFRLPKNMRPLPDACQLAADGWHAEAEADKLRPMSQRVAARADGVPPGVPQKYRGRGGSRFPVILNRRRSTS